MKKKLIISAIVVIVIVFFILFIGKGNGDYGFSTVNAERGDIESLISTTGTINPVNSVTVGSQVSGNILTIKVDFNSQVKTGQLLAEIDPSIYESRLLEAKANLLKGKVNLKQADRAMERGKELYKEKLISDRDLEDLEFAKENAAASLEQLEASYNVSLTNLKNCKIYSPVEGVVISRKIDVGQTVAASFQAPTLFVIGKDLSKMQIEVNIDEADIGRIKESQKVKFDVDAYPEETFWGKITQVRLEPVIVSNVVTYTVIVGVENSERKLKPGMTANVSVIEDSRKNVLKIPVAAARFRLSDELKAKYADESGPTNDNSKDNKINNEITAKGAGQVPANFKNLPADMPKNTSHFSRKLTGFSMNGNNGGEAKVSMRKIWLLKDNGKLEQIKIVLGISDGDFIEIVKGKITEKDKIVTEVLKDGKPLVQEENGFRLPMGGRH